MKVVILAGGLPSTLIDESEKIPKPMAEIGGRPILWHVMKQYAYYGYKEFIICAGYKGGMIKDYFQNFYIYQSDITVDLMTNEILVHRKQTEDWKVSVIDTGMHSSIIGRLRKIRSYLDDEPFLLTYGDCVSDINLSELVQAYKTNNRIVTLAVARPTGRNTVLPLSENGEWEKEKEDLNMSYAWVNACNMVLEAGIYDYLDDTDVFMGKNMLEKIAGDHQFSAYFHKGFWSPMETVRDRTLLEYMWNQKKAPWKVWEE